MKSLKNSMIGFPPPSAPGRVQRQYREYMKKLPKDVRDKVQGTLTFTYAELLRNKTIDPSNWSQVLKLMKANVGRVGDLSIGTGIVEKCLDDFSEFNKEPYKTVYNNATLNNSSNRNENELSDNEINDEVNLRIYKQSHLDKLGIEFNSDEFKSWLEENGKIFPVPLDAPARVRKAVYDMIDSAKDPGIKYYILKEFTRGFRKVKNHSDLNEYMKVTENILRDKKDYLKLLRMNETDDPIIKEAIEDVSELVNEILAFKNKLGDVILNYEGKGKLEVIL